MKKSIMKFNSKILYNKLTKNIKLTNNVIVIILVTLLIVLGVYWCFKKNTIIEGAESRYEQDQKDQENAEKEQLEKSKKLMTGLSDVFANAGID